MAERNFVTALFNRRSPDRNLRNRRVILLCDLCVSVVNACGCAGDHPYRAKCVAFRTTRGQHATTCVAMVRCC
jgi:hypothetical protein